MINFKKVEIDDKKWIDPLLSAADMSGCHHNFTNLFAWSKIYKYRVARVQDYMVVKGEQLDGVPYYFYPAGQGDPKSVIVALWQDAASCCDEFVLAGLSTENIEVINSLFPGNFEYTAKRDSFDYVYLLDKLVTLSGRKLNSKRNHINHFKKNNIWSFEQISPGNLAECWEMNIEWCKEHGCQDDEQLANENCAVRRCFGHFTELGLEGGLIRSEGRVIAYTMGDKLNSDTYDIHIEKAFGEIQGAYQMINQEFATFIRKKYPELIYVNREEDMGQEGLREAKLSYHPVKMEEKYWGGICRIEVSVIFTVLGARRLTKKRMIEIRLAKSGEIARQKEIWKLCFGDSDQYIDFFYANRYKEDETLLLLQDGEILAMLTMLPIKTIASDKRSFNSTMLYAVATHPKYQNRGFATQLMDFACEYLRKMKKASSVLVPSGKQLFDFYRIRGYQDAFYIREALFTWKRIESLHIGETCQCTISGITSEEFNQRRNKQLSGRLYVSYADEEIAYQGKLSRQSGADIYGIEIEAVQGCAAIERLNSDKVFIKELLIPDELLPEAVKNIAQLLQAKEYILRTPAFLGKQLGGSIRPFGVIRANREIDFEITPEDLGYLGFAFD